MDESDESRPAMAGAQGDLKHSTFCAQVKEECEDGLEC